MKQSNTNNRRMFTCNPLRAHYRYRQAFAVAMLAFSALLPLQGKQVTPRQALDIARKYVSPNKQTSYNAQTRGTKQPVIAPYYVFNDAQGKGFVVVSGDDAMGEILAYSDQGALDTLNANPGVKFLLQAYRERFEHLQQFPETPQPATRAMPERKAVAPLLTCEWDQVFPYNKNTGYPFTGCVATAVAQIMFYHKWPAQGQGENSYVVDYDKTKKQADFSKSHYDWASMKNKYNYYHPSSDVEKEAVALLMSDIGIATNMQYTKSYSGAYNEAVGPALQKHFDYTTAFVKRKDEGLAGFTDIIRQELLNGFPVYLSGNPYSRGAGHAWVTDGINEQGLFHMNFGWGGQSDGYFSLASLVVAQSGNEFGGRPMAFRYSLIAILIHPNKPNTRPIDLALQENTPRLKFSIEGSLRLPEGSNKRFAVDRMPAVEMSAFVNYGNAFKGDIGVGIFDMSGKLVTPCPSDDHATGGFTQRIFGQYDNGEMKRDNIITQTQKIKVNLANLADGYYQLLPICTPKQADGKWGEWIRMRQAPRMVVEIAKGEARVVEEGWLNAGFQLDEQPSTLWLKPNKEETLYVPIRNKSGLGVSCYAKLQLLDADGKVAFEAKRTKLLELEGFYTTWMPFAVNIPNTLSEGKYKMKLILVKENNEGIDNPKAQQFEVGNLYNKEATVITVSSQVTQIADASTAHYDIINNEGRSLTIRGNGLQRVKLFDINGRLLSSVSATDGMQVSVSLANFASGVYLVQVMANGKLRTHRVLKR